MSATSIKLRFMPHFFYSQFFVTPPKPTTNCAGKTIIVTGANVGLGKEAARYFVKLGAEKVVIACRSLEKGEAAKVELEEATKRKGVLDVWHLDLASYDSIKKFAAQAQTLKRVDVVLENAGIHCYTFVELAGNESNVGINVVSTFLLGLLLLPKLQETERLFKTIPRLTIVSSELHNITTFPEQHAPSIFGALNDEKLTNMGERYPTSKLLDIFAVREIAQNHPVDQLKVIVNTVNPGWCHSELSREVTSPLLPFIKAIFCRSTEVGARTLVGAALSGPNTHGKYLHNCKIHDCSPLVESKVGAEVQRRMWGELAAKLNEIQPGVTKLLDV